MGNDDKPKESEFFLDQNDEDANDDAESTKLDVPSSGSSSDGGSDDEGNSGSLRTFISQQWPQSYKYSLIYNLSLYLFVSRDDLNTNFYWQCIYESLKFLVI